MGSITGSIMGSWGHGVTEWNEALTSVLINLYLPDCVEHQRKLDLKWAS
jgi:hypothetical protein